MSTPASRASVLAQMYAPPWELMFKESWDAALIAGREQQKWIMINIQDPSVFDCMVLNRDLWKDPSVVDLIKGSFIFIQGNKDDPRAKAYTRHFFREEGLKAYPHVAIVNPETKALAQIWPGRVPQGPKFLTQVHELIDQHVLGKMDRSVSSSIQSPPSTRRRCGSQCPWKSIARAHTEPAVQPIAIAQHPAISGGDSLASLYQPLRVYQTRVIELAAGDIHDPLVCRLRTVDLLDMEGVRDAETGDVLQYLALSYSWGYGSETVGVLCNDVNVTVNANLAQTLSHVRSPQVRSILWCDALCINQVDQTEKAAQVRNMMRIFEKARSVVAWLGPEEDDTGVLFRALNRADLFEAGSETFLHDYDCLEGYSRFHSALETHSKRAWFRRVWVRQEVFAARKLLLKCGRYDVQFQNFLRAMRGMPDHRDVLQRQPIEVVRKRSLQIEERTVECTWPGTAAILARDYQHTGTDSKRITRPSSVLRHSVHWLRVLDEGTLFDVTYDIDRVYGALGIMTSPSNSFFVEEHADINFRNFPIDYNKTFSQVAQDVVKYLINTDRNLDVLMVFAARPGHPTHFPQSLPSWVIDWREQAGRSFIQVPPSRHAETRPKFDPPLQDYHDDGILRLKGVRISTLNLISGSNSLFESDMLPSWANDFDTNFIRVLDAHYVVGTTSYMAKAHDYVHIKADIDFLSFAVPAVAMLGDIVVAFQGSPEACLIRKSHVEGRYWFLGIIVLLQGNQFKSPDFSKVESEEFVLI